MRTIEDSISRGESRVDMGPGEESHKTRFSDCNSPIAWSVVMAPGRRLAQTFALTAPTLANSRGRDLVKRVLEPDQVDALRELRRKVRR
jgi:CelD/BcsL family acetyltransferase involved in cellulose biosynthesis